MEIDPHVTREIHVNKVIGAVEPTPSQRGDNPKGILDKILKHETKTLRKSQSVMTQRK